MPLPKINTPTYELTLPSNGKKIKYRPFLVREEKILIMALETEDQKQITDAVIQILDSCIMTRGVKIESLATFDIEYIFLNVRSKSVGETIKVNIICPGVISFGTLWAYIRSAKDLIADKFIALTGMMSALIFVLQMINFPIAAGTSGHLLGGALAVIVLGPRLGLICLSVVVIIQSLLFADGHHLSQI